MSNERRGKWQGGWTRLKEERFKVVSFAEERKAAADMPILHHYFSYYKLLILIHVLNIITSVLYLFPLNAHVATEEEIFWKAVENTKMKSGGENVFSKLRKIRKVGYLHEDNQGR